MKLWLALAALIILAACHERGSPPIDAIVVRPSEILDFSYLYGQNCSACHGANGKGSAAIALANPVYLAIADDTVIAWVASDGRPGTSMSAFAQHSGGSLTNAQIQSIVTGIRTWSKPEILRDLHPPHYQAQGPGDASHGAVVFETFCSSCHGAAGRGGRTSSIVDGAFLSLVSDQYLRTIVISGRPELGMPDWRSIVPGKPMSEDDVTNVVAWLVAQRPQLTGEPRITELQRPGGPR